MLPKNLVSSVGSHQDLDMLVFVVDQLLEALFNDIVQANAARDHLFVPNELACESLAMLVISGVWGGRRTFDHHLHDLAHRLVVENECTFHGDVLGEEFPARDCQRLLEDGYYNIEPLEA